MTAAGALWLTPIYGGLGMACMVSVGMIPQNITLSFLTKRHVGIWTFIDPSPREYARPWKYRY
jgi:hypothetical protein